MFCGNCGAPLDDNSVRCDKCGMPVQETGAPPYQSSLKNKKNSEMKREIPEYRLREERTPVSERTYQESSDKSSVVMYTILGVVIAILAGVIIWGIVLLVNPGEKQYEALEENDAESSVTDEELTNEELTNDSLTSDAVDSVTIDGTIDDGNGGKPAAGVIEYNRVLLSETTKLSPVDASATSTIKQDGVDNSVMVLMDGNEVTNWEEGVDGDGVGEQVTFRFSKAHDMKYLTFKLGNWKSKDYFQDNNRPKTLTLSFDDASYQVTFENVQKEFMVELGTPIHSEFLSVQIDSVYKGNKWPDTCISEIGVYAE
ncbi:MAG: zinc-ribbon domain-containing protein [Lachnospiraceae bacterium]|nr:zinc-ribbon domain-containing protein [Lachnospiraceae bacterium]MDD3616641.1 zinc-ribbon domain-containing protein [Lachnospiraceae bacterium]